MSKSKLLKGALNGTGLVVALVAVWFLTGGQNPLRGVFMTPAGAQEAYVDCLMTGYRHGKHRPGPKLLLESYQGCKSSEETLKQAMYKEGVKPEKMIDTLETINEATIARYMGVSLAETKGWGCLKKLNPPKGLVIS